MILLWCPSWYLKYKATYLNILLESIMPKNPATRQAKKKQTKSVSSSNKRQKPDLIIYDRFPQLGKPTFVQKDKFTGVNMPVFI